MSTLQERYANGEFDEAFKLKELSAAEIQVLEKQRLDKRAWLELPTTKSYLAELEKLKEDLLNNAMNLSAHKNSAEAVLQFVSRADEVKIVIEKLKQNT